MNGYTIEDARSDLKEAIEEGYSSDDIKSFLNYLYQTKHITWEDNLQLKTELNNGIFGEIEF